MIQKTTRRQRLVEQANMIYAARNTVDLLIDFVEIMPMDLKNPSLVKGDIIHSASGLDALLGKVYLKFIEEAGAEPEDPEPNGGAL